MTNNSLSQGQQLPFSDIQGWQSQLNLLLLRFFGEGRRRLNDQAFDNLPILHLSQDRSYKNFPYVTIFVVCSLLVARLYLSHRASNPTLTLPETRFHVSVLLSCCAYCLLSLVRGNQREAWLLYLLPFLFPHVICKHDGVVHEMNPCWQIILWSWPILCEIQICIKPLDWI